jgi:hypothetical protein
MIPTNFITALALLAGAAASVSARVWAGPVDMTKACHWQYGYNYTDGLDTSNGVPRANSWRCCNAVNVCNQVDVAGFCLKAYGTRNGQAPYADPQGGGPYDWGCYWP